MTCAITQTYKVSVLLGLKPVEITPDYIPWLPDNPNILLLILKSCTAGYEIALDTACLADAGYDICMSISQFLSPLCYQLLKICVDLSQLLTGFLDLL